MATYTVTATTGVSTQPRYVIGGEICRVQTYRSTATQSDTDVTVFEVCKVPHGATITGLELRGKTVDGTVIYQLGVNGAATVFGSATISATTAIKEALLGIPRKVSVSDDAAIRYETIQLTQDGAATSGTGSTSITVFVRYVMNE